MKPSAESFSLRKLSRDEALAVHVLNKAMYALNSKEVYRSIISALEIGHGVKEGSEKPIPSYTKIIRILEKLYKMKYIDRRPSGEKRAKFLYYLPDRIRAIVQAELAPLEKLHQQLYGVDKSV